MLDRDLAILYEVPTKALNQAVKRNTKRFPKHFMFQLNPEEKKKLVTNCDRLPDNLNVCNLLQGHRLPGCLSINIQGFQLADILPVGGD